ncbi:cisplatin damage response ATP-dependent DNA ligase [Alphaproteobacteria bacterium]|nr:cisplatin damage response ATP-dependent DNA ligase [Alphaproteobacteria bacterium]
MKTLTFLLDGLSNAPTDKAKQGYLGNFLESTSGADRGFGLAIAASELSLPTIKMTELKEKLLDRIDPKLFELSYGFASDLSETIALLWPASSIESMRIAEVVERLNTAKKQDLLTILESFLNGLEASERRMLLKLMTAGKRVSLSGSLAKATLASWSMKDLAEIEEVWPTLTPPYEELFDWLEGQNPKPNTSGRAVFKSMLSTVQLDEQRLNSLTPEAYAVGWSWSGLRVQLSSFGDEVKLFSDIGDDITAAFPDIVDLVEFQGVVEGNLLIVKDGAVQPSEMLQQRLERRSTPKKLLESHPAFLRISDTQNLEGKALNNLAFQKRRKALEDWFKPKSNWDLSELLSWRTVEDVEKLREQSGKVKNVEGLLLKRWGGAYSKAEEWHNWPSPPLTAILVLLYGEKRPGSSQFSELTLGARDGIANDGNSFLPVGKVSFQGTDEEAKAVHHWIENNTTERFGPVRSVKPGLWFSVSFASVQTANRRKAGLVLHSPAIQQVLWQEPEEMETSTQDLTNLIN